MFRLELNKQNLKLDKQLLKKNSIFKKYTIWAAPYTFTESGEQNIIANMLQIGSSRYLLKKFDKKSKTEICYFQAQDHHLKRPVTVVQKFITGC